MTVPLGVVLLSISLLVFGSTGVWAEDVAPVLIAFPIPPLIDEVDGKPVGPGAVLAADLAQAAGIDPVIVFMPLARALRRLETGGSVLALVSRTPERESKFTWVAPIYEDGQAFATLRPGPRIDSLDDARALRSIGVRNESVSDRFLQDHGFGEAIERSPEAAASARKLATGRIDAWFVASSMIRDVWTKAGLDPSKLQIGKPLAPSHYWLAASKDVAPDIVERMRTRFAALKADGSYQRIFGTLYLE